MARRIRCTVLLLACAAMPAFAEETPIPAAEARAVFAQAQALCAADGGRLWGASLCAPIMLVDPKTRRIVASQADADGALRARNGVYAGILPADQNVANTAVEWSGTRWTQMLWPLPDGDTRPVLIVHELFHNLQPKLAIAKAKGGENPHLDSLDGRYYLQLEWRALAKALESDGADDRRAAAADAVAFRMQRYRLFADARRDETALELNEGLAEYTGVAVAAPDASARKRLALQDLAAHVDNASFVRSFAYATGPAYGLLLDEFSPDWRGRLGEAEDLGTRLGKALGVKPAADKASLARAAARYDAAALRAAETLREEKRQAQLKRNRQRFVERPVLTLKLIHMKVQFNPSNLQPLDDLGTVYPTMRIADDWGTLEVADGALMKTDWSAVIVGAPEDPSAAGLRGAGWSLTLNEGWKLAPGARPGDYELAGPGG